MDLVGAFIWCWTLFWPPLVMTLGLFGLSGLYLGMKGSDRPLPKWVRNILSESAEAILQKSNPSKIPLAEGSLPWLSTRTAIRINSLLEKVEEAVWKV